MKSILTIFIFLSLVVLGLAQTRNVVVGTNGAVVSPTNFWSADVTNARSGLGLGSAATNPASAFQPSSTSLSNLAAGNGGSLTNLTASNVTGTIAISNGGSGATTAGGARTNLGLGATWLTNTNSTNFRSAIGLGDWATLSDGATIRAQAITISDGEQLDFIQFTTGGVVFNGTAAGQFRTALGLGFSALTNTNTAGFNTSLYGSGTNPVLYNTNGEVVSPTNFWQVAPITTTFIDSQPTTNQTTNIAAGRNLHIHSIAFSTVGITNTIALPTTNSFNGDIALVVHQGPTSSVTAVRQAGASTNLITLNQFEEAVEFVYYNSVWQFNHNPSYVEPIFFSGTNASDNRAASRTNLGLGATNDATFGSLTLSQWLISQVGASLEYNLSSNVVVRKTINTLELGNTIAGGVALAFATNNTTGAAISRTNLGLGLPALTNTNNTNFRTAIELGTTNSVTFSNVTASGTLTATGSVTTVTNLNVGGAINVTNKAETRTNLGISLAALTETNNANFQAAIFNTNSVPTNSANVNAINFNTAIHWMEVNVVTNGVTNNFRIPLFK